ncbi:MAG: hypothetical protein GY756_19290 [bacterium]|nr:hypothetical protein [bacterium]
MNKILTPIIIKIIYLSISLSCSLNASNNKIIPTRYHFVKVINNENKFPITINSKKPFFLSDSKNRKTQKATIQPGKTLPILFTNHGVVENTNTLTMTVNSYSATIDFPFNLIKNKTNNSKELLYKNIKWNFLDDNLNSPYKKRLNNINNRFILTQNMLFVKTIENNMLQKSIFKYLIKNRTINYSSTLSLFSNNIHDNFFSIILKIFPELNSFFNTSLNHLLKFSKFSTLTPLIVRNEDTGVSLDFSIKKGVKNKDLNSLQSIIFLQYKIKYLHSGKIKYKKIEAGTIKGFGKIKIKNIPLPGRYQKISISNLKILLKIIDKNDFFNKHSFNIKNISLLGCSFSKNNPYGLEGALNKNVYQMKVNYKPTGIELIASKR